MRSQALLDELQWRGLLYQSTDGVGALLDAGPTAGYCGFDPTASSLHVGNLVPVMGLVHLQRAGHSPVALVGGGTGLIGDPSGRASERALLTEETVDAHARSIHGQLERFLDFGGTAGARMLNNAEWLTKLGAIEFMRDIGKHFTVNYMLQKDSVKSRMEDGISYTEFSYMLLQAYDFLELNRRYGVRLQLGGSDQWGNLTAGLELIRRVTGAEAGALTLPLVTTSSGAKFGKSQAGAVWLDADRTSPYAFYQFWVNTDDRDVARYLRFFTLKSRDEIEALDRATSDHPDKREAQMALARDVTHRVHGEEGLSTAEEVSQLLFGGAEPRSLSLRALEALRADIPSFDLPAGGDEGAPLDTQRVVEAVCGESGLFKSRGDARRMLQQGGVYLNGARMSAEHRALTDADLLHGRYLLLRKGAKSYALVVTSGE